MADRTPEISIDSYAANRAEGITVDVRERMEYAYGHVPGAVWIPMGQLASRLGELDRSKPVHVICTTGNRSKAMADLLRRPGSTPFLWRPAPQAGSPPVTRSRLACDAQSPPSRRRSRGELTRDPLVSPSSPACSSG